MGITCAWSVYHDGGLASACAANNGKLSACRDGGGDAVEDRWHSSGRVGEPKVAQLDEATSPVAAGGLPRVLSLGAHINIVRSLARHLRVLCHSLNTH